MPDAACVMKCGREASKDVFCTICWYDLDVSRQKFLEKDPSTFNRISAIRFLQMRRGSVKVLKGGKHTPGYGDRRRW